MKGIQTEQVKLIKRSEMMNENQLCFEIRKSEMNRRNSTLSEENFMKYLKNIFEIIDSDHEGFIRLDEMTRHLQNNKSTENRPRMMKSRTDNQNSKIISALNQVAPASGLLNFQRFSLAMKIALGRVSADHSRGIGRSLRPRSFLFAVTESSESESECSINNHESNDELQNILLSTRVGGQARNCDASELTKKEPSNQNKVFSSEKGDICLTEKANLESLLEHTTKKLLVLKKSMQEVEALQKWHRDNLTAIEERRKLLENLVSVSDERVESDRSSETFDKKIGLIDVSKLSSHISQLLTLKESLTALVDENPHGPEKNELLPKKEDNMAEMLQKIKDQSDRIEKLETEKAVLVKDLFHARAKLTTAKQTEEAMLPF